MEEKQCEIVIFVFISTILSVRAKYCDIPLYDMECNMCVIIKKIPGHFCNVPAENDSHNRYCMSGKSIISLEALRYMYIA